MNASLYTKAFTLINSSKNILVSTHEHPDGDALASVCLIAEILSLLNKKYSLYCYDQINYQLNFLPHIDEFKNYYESFDFDLIIILDCGDVERAKLNKEILSRKPNQLILEIDHHQKMKDCADLEIRDSTAAATTEILYYFLKANKIKINKDMANCILTGILTDTGNFLYPSTSSETVNIASEMLTNGAKLPQIIENTWRNKSIASMKTWGKAMSRLKINQQYNFGFTILKSQDVPAEVTEEELEGISGFLSNLSAVNGIMLLRQLPDGKIKGSLRTSKPNVDVSKLARALGGGGHTKASGFTVEGNLEKTANGWKIE
ncbi:bifunctional oligoribonuclease/PAP phosphatase NrnA [Patescibacteria group bacterium]|nr:bifunctional oligoribonuclease/PAP phosphatase NrnA [Patescibacteria group bacterium]MBU1663458.1 bifunctional oligoribonuclease/PAP phosphatase NrnA [Patescibacteria group bacterium]MBU1934109.1 bifunctional oligoribonuclease/PAP phosphatase NrnA [Patescibacteria group bacterium]MBU2007754.1 bifunctional oligoribonuclease/PAP phosphatase NrnA [Patescibacteria group bacterium]MBU2233879.1 bifunctional oligoribonuclease/PAP phosphatase NrnA [Patescibacteria group bacterium]